jgi:hypothetical protein
MDRDRLPGTRRYRRRQGLPLARIPAAPPEEGFRWLVEAEGHWSWVSPVGNPPRYQVGQTAAIYKGEEYKRFAAGSAVTRYVIGEFTWKVAVGETWETIDFVAPPHAEPRGQARRDHLVAGRLSAGR